METRSANSPAANTIRPAQWWLYSDQAMSAGPLVFGSALGTYDARTGKLSLQKVSGVTGASSPEAGVFRAGQRGAIRCRTSLAFARSTIRSTAGGCDVRDTAARITVNPIPISTSANRRRHTNKVESPACSRLTILKFQPPRINRSPKRSAFESTITP